MVKYFMLLVNLVFALAGIFLIGVGTFIQVNAKTYLDFLSDNYLNTPIAIIILGVIIFIVAFFGCCGAWQESSCMIYTYAVFISVLLVCECGAGIAAFMLKGDLKDVMEHKFKDGLKNYNTEGHEGVTNTWNTIQHDLKCCGVTEPADWLSAPYGKIPRSCCKSTETEECEEKDAYSVGCLALAEDKFISNIAVVGGVALGVAFLQLIGVIFSCCLANRIKKSGQYV
jgi:CD63 antigen